MPLEEVQGLVVVRCCRFNILLHNVYTTVTLIADIITALDGSGFVESMMCPIIMRIVLYCVLCKSI